MKSLIEKYKTWQKLQETKDYEEWKRTKSKSAFKKGLLLSFAWFVAFSLLRVWNLYSRPEFYTLDELKNDLVHVLFVSLLGGTFVSWFLNNKYRTRLNEERTKQK